MRTLSPFKIRTVTTLTKRTGGEESSREVSPSESSSQRLWTFLVPGLTPHEAKESEGNRVRSQSESVWGVEAKGGCLGFVGRDMVGNLKGRRG